MTALPAWIDPEAWAGYVDMRKTIKKPMTARAEILVLKELFTLKSRGHDPNAALDQSVVHNWTDVYEPKAKDVSNLIRQETPQEAPRTPEQKAADDAARRRVMEMLRPAIKLVRSA